MTVIIGLAIGGVFLLAIITLAAYAAVTLPPQARIPMHWAGRYDNFRSKRYALIAWVIISAGLYALLAGVSQVRSHGNSPAWTLAVVAPIVMCVVFVTEIGAIAAARRTAGAGPGR